MLSTQPLILELDSQGTRAVLHHRLTFCNLNCGGTMAQSWQATPPLLSACHGAVEERSILIWKPFRAGRHAGRALDD